MEPFSPFSLQGSLRPQESKLEDVYSLLLDEVQEPGLCLLQGVRGWEEPSLSGPKGEGSSGMFCSTENTSATGVKKTKTRVNINGELPVLASTS